MLTIARFSKYSFTQTLQYIYRAAEYSLGKPKIVKGNLGKPNFTEMAIYVYISNLKYTANIK